jgi:Gpi18-like mannosyltransferase
MNNSPTSRHQSLWTEAFLFGTLMGLLSRLVIFATLLLLAPSLPAPPGGITPTADWSVFSYSDSPRYEEIATSGYQYGSDIENQKYNIVFFPLFPLLTRAVMALGLSFDAAGTIINNLAFLGALVILYRWVAQRHSKSIARWATAVLAWCPLTLFASVTYTEALFLLLTTASLKTFDQHQYAWAALCGALATATRVTAVALIPTFFLVAWRERRPWPAYLAGIFTASGLLAFIVYCAVNFGDPLAFVHAQKAWRETAGINWKDWRRELIRIGIGITNLEHRAIVEPWHPLIFVAIGVSAYLVWRFQDKIGSTNVFYIFCALGLSLWLLASDALIVVVMVFGGAYLLWCMRSHLSLIVLTYGFCSLALIMTSGSAASAHRYAYGIVSLSIALGMLLEQYRRWGYATIAFFTLVLINFSLRFAQHIWVA